MAMSDDPLAAAKARARLHREKTDMDRILDVPIVSPPPADVVDRWTRRLRRHPGAPPLRYVQAWALDAISQIGGWRGLFGSIGVGHGKTGICELAGTVAGARRPLLLIPPALRGQHARDREWWLRHYNYVPPRVMTYGELSQPSASDALEEYQPDMIIADEAHSIRNRTAARTKRVLRYARAHPSTRFVLLSGTMSRKSLRDYAILAELALRDLSPLPLSFPAVDQWASVIDVDGVPDHNALDAVWPLVTLHRGEADADALRRAEPVTRRAAAREGYQYRFRTTPGVITTSDASVGASIILSIRRPDLPAKVSSALSRLGDTWETPDGEEVIDALHMHRIASQLSAGFWYRWDWTFGGTRPDEPDHEWLEARREWHRELAHALRYASRTGHDSPALIARACQRGDGPPERIAAWRAWSAVRDRPVPPTVPVWLDTFLIDDAISWATGRRALIWYQSRAVGDALAARGIPVYGQGSDTPPEDLDVVALSIPVHHKGRNLQAWSDQLVIEPPASGATWEQLLGRTHRQGQVADEVTATIYGHTWAFRRAIEQAIAEALYIEQTTGQKQKLNICAWAD